MEAAVEALQTHLDGRLDEILALLHSTQAKLDAHGARLARLESRHPPAPPAGSTR